MIFTILASALLTAPGPLQSDTLDAVREMRAELGAYYYESVGTRTGRVPSREEWGDALGWRCDADEGSECFDGDPDWSMCRADSPCYGRRTRSPLEDRLVEAAREHPTSGFLYGQAVYMLLKSRDPLTALQLLEGCGAVEWWCAALEGTVLQESGRPDLAMDKFEAFLASVPDDIRCDWDDGTWLLGRYPIERSMMTPPALEERRPWVDRDCTARKAASARLFWLSDPLFVVEGNDRWTAYLSSVVSFILAIELSDTEPSARIRGDRLASVRAADTRRGRRDSWELYRRQRIDGTGGFSWTSLRAARYHFVPDFHDFEDLTGPTWSLQSDFELEGYTPAYAPFYEADVQIARFRSETAGLQRIAAATSVAGTPIEAAVESGYLIFTDAPESFPLQLEAQFQDARAVYLPDAEPKPYVASFEVLTAEGIGWHREQVQPLALEGDGVSDLLLYRPVGMEEPISVLAATALMHGSTEVEAAEQGVYWEVYGAPEGTPIEFSLEIRSEDTGGLMNQVRRLFGGTDDRDATLSWSEPSQGERHSRAIILDLRDLEPGEYTVTLHATWDDNDAVVTADRSVSVR